MVHTFITFESLYCGFLGHGHVYGPRIQGQTLIQTARRQPPQEPRGGDRHPPSLEEALEFGGDDLGGGAVGLARERAVRSAGQQLGDRAGRVSDPGGLAPPSITSTGTVS